MLSSLVKFCGWVAIAVSCAIVLAVVVLVILAGICTGLGAYDSATNPHASQQAAQEYQNVSSQLASIHQNSFEPAYIKNASSAGK